MSNMKQMSAVELSIYDEIIKTSYSHCGVNDDKCLVLSASLIPTPLGSMIAIGDDNGLYYLNFIDAKNVQKVCMKICADRGAYLVSRSSLAIDKITVELAAYFAGSLKSFTVPLNNVGTSFQQQAWDALHRVPYGETKSYADQACALGRPLSHRAVANANAANVFAIVIPCHRIIGSGGKLSGYGGGVDRKKWLIDHEWRYSEILCLK